MTTQGSIQLQQERAAARGGKCISDIYINSRTKLTWQCEFGHIWDAKPNKIQCGRWCPHCAGRKKDLSFVQSVAQDRNGVVLDTEYKGTKYKYTWKCESGHIWRACLCNVVHSNRWCPYCAGNARLTIEEMHTIAQSKGGKCLSTAYTYNGEHLKWQCKCGYIWSATPHNIKTGRWCPKCSDHLPLTIDIAQDIAIKRGGVCLSKSIHGGQQLLTWKCGKGHTWPASLSNVKNKESWCPHCRTWSTEEKCREIFQSYFSKPFPRNRQALGCRLELDGYCAELKVAFEYNGEQHYYCFDWFKNTPDKLRQTKERDRRKILLCEKLGIKLIIIPYTEVKNLKSYITSQLQHNLIVV